MNVVDYSHCSDAPSRSFRVSVDGHAVKVVETPPMDAAERARLAEEYRKIPYAEIYDVASMHVHYAHVGAGGSVAVRIDADVEIHSFRVHPFRREIRGVAAGKSLTFETGASRPGYFIVRINALPPLALIVDALELTAPTLANSDVIDAAQFLDDSTGATDQTPHFLRAFAAANHSGKTLLVPSGVYSVTQLHISRGRNFRIYLPAGCLIKVAPSRHGENEHRHGLWLQDSEDITIDGRGCIDHQAYEHYVVGRNHYQHGLVNYYTANELCPWTTQSPLFITGSRRITIDGLTIRNGRNFNINCRNCDDLVIRGVKILTPPACTPEYADGINTGSCQNVLVENCLIISNDDSIASGHYFSTYDNRPSGNHVVRGVLGWTLRGSGARLGFYADHDQGDFTFENCDFVAMVYTSCLIHPLRPGTDGRPSRYGTIRMRDCAFDEAERLDSFLDAQKPVIERLELVNVTFFGKPRESAAIIVAGDPAHPIGRVLLENMRVAGRFVIELSQVPSRIENVREIIVTAKLG